MSTSSSHLTHNPSMITLILLTSFAAAGAMFLTPALPLMASTLSITAEHVQLVVSVYLAGYALGMLPYGPFANRFGRKPTLYFGLVLAIIGALLSVIAGSFQHFNLLVLGRLVTAVGASVGLKIAYTIVGDLYSHGQATKKNCNTHAWVSGSVSSFNDDRWIFNTIYRLDGFAVCIGYLWNFLACTERALARNCSRT